MSVDVLIRTRGGLKSRVTILIGQSKTIIDQGNTVRIDAHRKNIEYFMKKIEALDAQILDTFETNKEVEDDICKIASYHHTVLENLETLRRSTPTPIVPGEVPKGKHTKSPKINLPFFSGDQMEWTSFWDIFNQSIH